MAPKPEKLRYHKNKIGGCKYEVMRIHNSDIIYKIEPKS